MLMSPCFLFFAKMGHFGGAKHKRRWVVKERKHKVVQTTEVNKHRLSHDTSALTT